MSMFFGLNLSAMSAKSVGSVWQPKASRLSVGKELSPLSGTCFSGEDRKVVTARGDDTRFMSGDLFKTAKSVASMGLKAIHFRSVKTEDYIFGSMQQKLLTNGANADYQSANIAANNQDLLRDEGSQTLLFHGNRKVTFDGSEIKVLEKDEHGNYSILVCPYWSRRRPYVGIPVSLGMKMTTRYSLRVPPLLRVTSSRLTALTTFLSVNQGRTSSRATGPW